MTLPDPLALGHQGTPFLSLGCEVVQSQHSSPGFSRTDVLVETDAFPSLTAFFFSSSCSIFYLIEMHCGSLLFFGFVFIGLELIYNVVSASGV